MFNFFEHIQKSKKIEQMKISKKILGVWLDHTKAQIIEEKSNSITSYTIESLSIQGEK